MSRALTPGLTITPRTQVEKIRELPVMGEVLVSPGDRVGATDIVARAALPGDLYILRLPERMGLESFEVMKGLRVAEGQQVKTGDLMCEHAGMFGLLKTRFAAPEDGTIEFIAEKTAHVGLRLPSTPVELDAFIAGEVTAIEPGKSVTVQTEATFVQGIFGVGGERHGKLYKLDVAAEEVVSSAAIPASGIDNCVLFGGACPSLEALHLAAERGAIGLVTGGIDDQVLASYLGYDLGIALTGDEEIPLTLIVTEGFGALPLSRRVDAVLAVLHGQEVSINGATQVRAGAVRPEVIVSLTPTTSSHQDPREEMHAGLEVGRTIRIIRVPFFGKRARVVELPHEPQELDSGALARVLVAELEEGGRVIVPRANVELI